MGTTVTPSSLRYAIPLCPLMTQRAEGRGRFAFSVYSLNLKRLRAAFSV